MPPAFQRGQLYWAKVPYLPERPLDILRRGRQKGELRVVLTFKRRPVLIVQNDRDNANPRYHYLLIAPVHSLKPPELARLQEVNYPTDLLLTPPEGRLTRPSVIFLNQLRTLNKNLLTEYIGDLPVERVAELNVKLALSLGLIAP
jgi:mRNA-degrading endonuclease toxin of MazEF toxin-antitoxin module